MKIYGVPISPFVRKTRFVLELKGLDYEIEGIFPGTKTPEYLAISPLGKIPAFEDGDDILCDSNVIIEYLEEKYPEIPARPSSLSDRTKCRWLEEYAGSMMFGPLAAGIFMERLTKPYSSNQPADESVVADCIANRVPPVFDYIESQLPQQGFFFGDISVADIAVGTATINAGYSDFEVNSQLWPRVSAHLKLVKEHPVVRKCMETEKPLIDALLHAQSERQKHNLSN